MKEKILEVLREVNEEILEDTERDLLATGILDSFDIVNMVVELEEAFDIVIDVDLVTPDNFRTADSIINVMENIIKG
ncbi:phosphopantetheine-binding protein [Lachnospiraceae bacterium 42-17]|jgi:D-alanine--poly(phosphoribitol) ligase subunit 2